MNYSNEAAYMNMVSSFRTTELQELIGAFNLNKIGPKNELKERALEIIRNKPPGVNLNAFLAKINEINQNIDVSEGTNNQTAMHHQQQQQRMNQLSQNTQQLKLTTQAGLPQIQSGVNGNNGMPYNQPTGSSSMIIHTPNMAQHGFLLPNTLYTEALPNYYAPSAQYLMSVKMKKFPFFKVVGDIMKPTVMIGQEKCIAGRVMNEVSFKVVLTGKQSTLVTLNRDISDGKQDYVYQVQIRICQIYQGCTEISDCMPPGIQIKINNKYCTLPPIAPNSRPGTEARRLPLPIDGTPPMKLNPNIASQMILNWFPDDNTYVVSMHLVQKLTSDYLLKALIEKGSRSSEETKNYIIEKLTDVDPDLATTNYRFSLLCPLSKMRMKVPAKSVKCEHLQCFDAFSFLQMNEKKPTWMCPTCNNPCLYDEIKIENYFLDVVSSSKITDDIKEIEILADGTWKVYEATEDSEIISDDKEKLIESISLDDSDESNDSQENKSLNLNDSENIKSSFIDLTLDVDDEETPKEELKQENEAQVANEVQSATDTNIKPQAQVQPQQDVTSSEEEIIRIHSPYLITILPPLSPTPTTSAS